MDTNDPLATALEAALDAVNASLRGLSARIDAEGPGGPQNIALITVMRAYGQLLAEELSAPQIQEVQKLQSILTRAMKGMPPEQA